MPNNLGGWPVERVESGLESRGSTMHTAKGLKMTPIAEAEKQLRQYAQRQDKAEAKAAESTSELLFGEDE